MSTHWTEQDEATLRELTERKMRFTDEAKEPLQKIVSDLWLGSTHSTGVTVNRLIEHAAELRDALAPFDLRKPAADPIEAAIRRGTFRIKPKTGVREYDVRKVERYWLTDDETEAREGSYRTDGTVRSWMREGTWRLVE